MPSGEGVGRQDAPSLFIGRKAHEPKARLNGKITRKESTDMSVGIHFEHIVKKYGENVIIPDLNLDVREGEFFTLLGPSGCGKTTLLRMVAGFNSIEGGTIAFNGRVINDIAPNKRNIGMVFQNYAVFPHMTVRENVAFGLENRHLPKNEIKRRVDEILETVKITQYADRLPERLSGGQQQRVALARAIVIHPQVLLMDEPLSHLDAKLRIEMRSVIHDIQRQVGITTVYVSHDLEEARAISDLIAVMNMGVIQQIGTPHLIYSRQANVFVATFIGHSNLFHATLSKKDGRTELCFPSGYRLPMTTLSDECTDGQEVVVGIRPEEFSVSSEGLTCDVLNRTFLGRYSNYFLHFADGMCVPDQPSIEFSQDLGHTQTLYQPGDHLTLRPNPDKINVFTADMEKSLLKDVIRYEQA